MHYTSRDIAQHLAQNLKTESTKGGIARKINKIPETFHPTLNRRLPPTNGIDEKGSRWLEKERVHPMNMHDIGEIFMELGALDDSLTFEIDLLNGQNFTVIVSEVPPKKKII